MLQVACWGLRMKTRQDIPDIRFGLLVSTCRFCKGSQGRFQKGKRSQQGTQCTHVESQANSIQARTEFEHPRPCEGTCTLPNRVNTQQHCPKTKFHRRMLSAADQCAYTRIPRDNFDKYLNLPCSMIQPGSLPAELCLNLGTWYLPDMLDTWPVQPQSMTLEHTVPVQTPFLDKQSLPGKLSMTSDDRSSTSPPCTEPC